MFGNRKVMVEMPAESAGASGGGVVYGGFWARFAAVMVDSAIVTVVGVVLMVVLFMAMGAAGVLIGNIAFFILQLLYWPVMESSARQATFGKSLMGLQVTDLQGNRTSFVKSLLRNLAKILSSLIMMIGFLLAAFTARKQGLHDMLAGCLVVRTGSSSFLKAVVATVVALAIAGYGGYYYVTQIYMPQAMGEMDKTMKGAGQDMARDMDKAMKQAEAEHKRKMQEQESKRKMEQEAQKAAVAPPASAPAPVPPVPAKAAVAATPPASKPVPVSAAPVEKKRAPAAVTIEQSKTAASNVPGRPSAPAVEASAPRIAAGPAPKYNDVMSAVMNRDLAGAAEALAVGIWVDRTDSRGTTPLMVAAENGDVPMVQLLLKHGANPNSVGRDGSVLSHAQRGRDGKTVDLLLKAGAR